MTDLSDATAHNLIDDIIDADVDTAVPEECVLDSRTCGTTFYPPKQITVCHRDWMAGRDADAYAECGSTEPREAHMSIRRVNSFSILKMHNC
jgi:hypothetical protein